PTAALRCDGTVWTTDKDRMVPALFAAELTARRGHDPAEHYRGLCDAFGEVFFDRVEAPASAQQKKALGRLSPDQLKADRLAGAAITSVLDRAPGNDAPIGGIKVVADTGWFAARPSGTEDIYKIYGESFESRDHLQTILAEAQGIVDAALGQDG